MPFPAPLMSNEAASDGMGLEALRRNEALRLSEERFVSAFEHASIGMALVAPDGRWLKVNQALCHLIGYPADELHQKTFQDLTHPDDLDTDLKYVRQMLAEEIFHYQMPKRYFHKNGHIVWVLLNVSLVRDKEGVPLYFISQIQDITEQKESELRLKRMNRLYSVLSRINEALVRTQDEKALCEKVCQIAVEQGQMKMAWLGEVDPATKRIIPCASAGNDDGYLASMDLSSEEGAKGNSPAGCAVRQGALNVSHDVASDPRMAPWREAALQRGFRSIAAFPIRLGCDRRGVMALYAEEPHFFNQEEMDLLVSLSENISFALDSIQKERLRLEAEDAMRKSEERYRLLFSDNPHPMWVYDRETQAFLAVNSSAQRLYGYTEAEFLAMTIWDIRPSEEHPKIEQVLRSLTPEKNATTSLHHKKNGDLIRVDIFSDSIVFNGRAARLVSVTDVTQREIFEQKLAEQAALIDQARDAIVVSGLEHEVRFWNKGAERVYGWTASEAVGRKSIDFLYRGTEKFTAAMQSVLGRGGWIGELEHITKTGEAVIVESRWSLLRDAEGQPKAILCINTDITERKQMETHFLRAQRMESIGTLAGGIAHDLNNLLAPIMMGVDLLKHFGVEGPSLKVVEDIERSAKRGSSLVKQVLSFARGVEGSRITLQIRDIIGELESIIKNTFPKNITLETRIPRDTWLIEGDPTQLNQVLLNLCVNARDAMPGGGRILLSAQNMSIDASYEDPERSLSSGRYVCLDVVDTGCGIPAENLEKIFDPFFTTKELAKGTGLGLATTLGIVRSHGGFLNVASEVGRGTTFKIYLPAQAEGTALAAPSIENDGWPRGNGEWILLVDDETSILDVNKQTLEAFGYHVLTAEQGAQAIGLFALNRDKIALVLTDMMMPVMDGPATVLALRQIDPRIRIIAASGMDTEGHATKVAIAGVKHFLAKPYSTGILLNTVKTALVEET